MGSLSSWVKESPLVRVVAGFALAGLVLAAFGWLVTGPYKNFLAGFDSNIRYAMRQIQSPMWTSLLLTVTNLGSTLYLIIVGSVAGIAFLALRWFRSFFLFVIAMAGQAALHHGSKWMIARSRPSNLINYRTAESFSFPSGHALAALCLFGMIAWIITRRIESPAVTAVVWICTFVLIFLIGASRVYIGIHYPTDVVAGFLGGVIWLAAVMSIDRRPL
jgi:undecaprenyl-diphosphatase